MNASDTLKKLQIYDISHGAEAVFEVSPDGSSTPQFKGKLFFKQRCVSRLFETIYMLSREERKGKVAAGTADLGI